MSEDPRPIHRAMHRDRCGLCDEPIYEGDTITAVDGEWVHVQCAEDEDESRRLQGDVPL